MKPFSSQTVAEQVAAHLRGEIEEGRVSGLMPGVLKLEAEIGVNRKTVEAALQILERDGILRPQGVGKRRLIAGNQEGKDGTGLRVGLMFFERADRGLEPMQLLEHKLGEAGHLVIESQASLTDLKMDVDKVARAVAEARADAWVVQAASREVLEWFIAEGIPVMALFGRRRGLPLASVGPDKTTAYREATRMLVSLGHRRIVWLTRRLRRLPKPGAAEQTFLDELAAQGLTPGTYNLPDWEETVGGLHACLDSLFQLTPPTAIIADEPHFYVATQNYISSRGLSVPGDVSLACTDGDPYFDWCQPSIAHIHWNRRSLVRRIVQWAGNVRRGKEDKRHTFIKAEFVSGGTIGRVP